MIDTLRSSCGSSSPGKTIGLSLFEKFKRNVGNILPHTIGLLEIAEIYENACWSQSPVHKVHKVPGPGGPTKA